MLRIYLGFNEIFLKMILTYSIMVKYQNDFTRIRYGFRIPMAL